MRPNKVHERNHESDKYTKCLKVGNYTFEKVCEFKYLGALITSNNNLSTEIRHRLQIANSCYLGLGNQLWSQWTRINAKLKLYKKLTRAVLLSFFAQFIYIYIYIYIKKN